jgi:hypothetical protein
MQEGQHLKMPTNRRTSGNGMAGKWGVDRSASLSHSLHSLRSGPLGSTCERPHPALSVCSPATGKRAAVAVIKLGRPQVTPPTSVECQLFEGLNSHCRPAAEVWQDLRCMRRSAEIAGIFVRL